MDKVVYYFKQSWLLLVAAFLFGLLIAVTNSAWQGKIDANQPTKINSKIKDLIPDANTIDVVDMGVDLSEGKGLVTLTSIFKALDSNKQVVGYGYTAVGSGFQDKIKLIIAMDTKFGKFLGYRVLASNETPGFGTKISEDYYRKQFVGAPAGILTLSKTGDPGVIDSEIIAISGATVSSNAVVNKIFNVYTEKVQDYMKSKGIISDDQ